MTRNQLPVYALAAAIAVAGLAVAGVPAGTLVVLPVVLACPLMMFFMMRGMDHAGHDRPPRESSRSKDYDSSGR